MKNTSRSRTILYFNNMILTPLYLLFLLTTSLFPIFCNSYTPTENITVACGSSDNTTAPDGREWVADIVPNYLSLLEQKHNSSIPSPAQRPSPQASFVPYLKARISLSDFTYVFSVTAGQKFIRLHFYPYIYQNFDPSKAFFSVKANKFILLNNFSASLTAASLGSESSDYLFKEFCINIEDEDQTLNLTFTPSSTPSDAHAFINGIEIVSMPTNLYYTPAEAQDGITFIGYEQTPIRIENNTALETVHRLNVGGSEISPVEDTGMFRSWNDDSGYVSNIGALPVNHSFEVLFTKVPNYTAPAQVYMTARSMGNNKTVNKNYNLTWNLPVDSGFTYLVRLHFCEFQVEVTKQSDREFTIFIADKTAEPQADVIVWAGRNHVPFCRDYAVMVSQGRDQKKQNLSIALHPNPESTTVYSDAILNGVEVFKLSDYSGNLAGLNPDPVPPPASPSTPQPANTGKQKTTPVAAVVGGVLSGVVALCVLALLIFRQRRRDKESGFGKSSYTAKKHDKMSGPLLPSDLCRRFSFAEIKTATDNFNGDLIIGRGGFGDVYKGCTDDGTTQVAIKRLKQGSQQGAHEFETEIEMLSQLRHLHLVSLIGYCNDEGEMILVYEYMSRGTLRDHLYGSDYPSLPWKRRLEICIGSARGLKYLHDDAKHRIIHRDVKTTNILLDDKWVAKVSDFGLSKANSNLAANTAISTVVKGSFGYLDPEYFRRQRLTEKSDVYSFGVVLLEVLCAKSPVNRTALERDQVSLAAWARKCYQNGTLDQIIDPHLSGKIEPECLKRFAEIAMKCLDDEGTKRPPMNEVAWTLEFALELQEGKKEGIKTDGADVEFKERDLNCQIGPVGSDDGQVSTSGVTMTSDGGTSFTTDGSDKMSSGAVFSEIMNTSGR
ncbi:receptor-like protein kinase FERONIA [Cornus florida]|uniref:receptor-like protein kinase FERONIA n=1 Tax=Cornus florida TaxID=4283 RepID=UPI0028A18260|nr:receptor-like protein kinase FERONIA [Cornus florida]